MTTETRDMTLGELISMFYQEYLDLYGDEELASVATAATINGMIIDAEPTQAAADPPVHRRNAA